LAARQSLEASSFSYEEYGMDLTQPYEPAPVQELAEEEPTVHSARDEESDGQEGVGVLEEEAPWDRRLSEVTSSVSSPPAMLPWDRSPSQSASSVSSPRAVAPRNHSHAQSASSVSSPHAMAPRSRSPTQSASPASPRAMAPWSRSPSQRA